MVTNRTNESIVIATFDTSAAAEQAVEALHDAGFTSDQIRYSAQYKENFLQSVKDMLIFPDESQDESLNDIDTMLLNMGLGPNEIQYYINEFNSGRFVVVVRPDGRDQEASTILQNNGGKRYIS